MLSDAPGISISEAARQRVRETAQGLGYVPHSIARALREGSSRIVVLSIDSGYNGNYLRSFTRELDDELAAHDYVLLVRHGHSAPGSQQRLLDAISPRAVPRMITGGGQPARSWDSMATGSSPRPRRSSSANPPEPATASQAIAGMAGMAIATPRSLIALGRPRR